MDVWARPSREGVGNGEPWIKARVTPVLVIEMSRKSLGGWRAKYSRGWQKDVFAQGDGEPHVLGTAVATFCQKMGQSGKRTNPLYPYALLGNFFFRSFFSIGTPPRWDPKSQQQVLSTDQDNQDEVACRRPEQNLMTFALWPSAPRSHQATIAFSTISMR